MCGRGGCPPPLYKVGWSSLSHTHSSSLPLICPKVGIFLPLLAAPLHERGAQAKPCSRTSPPPPPWRRGVGVPGDPLLPLPNWSKGRRSSSDRTCDRLRRCCPFVAPIFATLRSGVYTLHQPRLFAGTLSRCRSSRVSPFETVTSISQI